MNEITSTGILSLPSIDGKSHVETELTLDEDIAKGATVLLDTIIHLANIKIPYKRMIGNWQDHKSGTADRKMTDLK